MPFSQFFSLNWVFKSNQLLLREKSVFSIYDHFKFRIALWRIEAVVAKKEVGLAASSNTPVVGENPAEVNDHTPTELVILIPLTGDVDHSHIVVANMRGEMFLSSDYSLLAFQTGSESQNNHDKSYQSDQKMHFSISIFFLTQVNLNTYFPTSLITSTSCRHDFFDKWKNFISPL